MNKSATLEEILPLAQSLPALDKLRLIELLVNGLETDFVAQGKPTYNTLYGALADLGPAPSAEEIDEARREAWANFPREDIAWPLASEESLLRIWDNDEDARYDDWQRLYGAG